MKYRKKWFKPHSGEWFRPAKVRGLPRWYIRQGCCDCNLVHLWIFEITDDGRPVMKLYRDDYTTARLRSQTKKEKRRARDAKNRKHQ